MSRLLYREDMDEVRDRLTRWWNGEDIGRPALLITMPREKPVEHIPVMPEPAGWLTHYSTTNFEYRVNLAARQCINTHYLGEAVPFVSPDLAPNCLALYLGCKGVEQRDTVWCVPFIKQPETARLEYDPANFYWQFSLRLGREMLRIGRGKLLIQFPDLIEGLDTLGAMRGSQQLLIDLLEWPDWVHGCLRRITDFYFRYYDVLYDLFRDEVGGSVFWMWAPGRMAKLQCDFSAMISADAFGEFMAPVLGEMTERLSYSMYHWDGPGALQHHDHLLAIPRLNMIQWTPGAGVEPPCHKRWWPYHHKTVEAGKKVFVHSCGVDEFRAMKREFGARLRHFAISMQFSTTREAKELIASAYE